MLGRRLDSFAGRYTKTGDFLEQGINNDFRELLGVKFMASKI
jgi:hypothetical protein